MSRLPALFPTSSGTFEKALAAAMDYELPFDYAVILDPYQTPEQFLPFLAYGCSVDLWFDDWPIERKREMIAQCMGRSVLYPGEELASLKGTFEGLKRYLWFVDAEVVDRVAYPLPFVIGMSAIGITPINHPPFKARYLIKVALDKPPGAFIVGLSAIGLAALSPPSDEPILRAKRAALVAKFEHTEYLVSFTHRRQIRFGDRIGFGDGVKFGAFVDKKSLND